MRRYSTALLDEPAVQVPGTSGWPGRVGPRAASTCSTTAEPAEHGVLGREPGAVYILRMYTSAMNQPETERRRRINMRVSERQERVLRAAADLSGETLTGFVLAVATERAEEVLARGQRIDLDVEAFERFVAALDGPVEEMPTLRRYAGEPSPIPLR